MDEDQNDSLNSSFFEEEDETDREIDPPAPSRRKGGKSVKPPLATCRDDCGNKFYALEGYKKHMESHLFNELLLLAPKKEIFRSTIIGCAKEVLRQMSLKPVTGGKGPEVQELVQTLLEPEPSSEAAVSQFFDFVAEESWRCLSPTATKVKSAGDFHSAFVQAVIVWHSKNRAEIAQCLKECLDVRQPVVDCFLCDFINKVSIRVEAAFIKAIRTPHFENAPAQSACDGRDDLQSADTQQCIHYVGGASVKSVLSKARRASKSPQWQIIAKAIQTRMLVGELVEAAEYKITAWTNSRNRGGLQFIGTNALTFFVALSDILKYLETQDGSLLHKNVAECVEKSDVMSLLWDEVIGDTLPSEESKLLHHELIVSFTNTWGHGITYRRQNALLQRGDSVALRAKLSK